MAGSCLIGFEAAQRTVRWPLRFVILVASATRPQEETCMAVARGVDMWRGAGGVAVRAAIQSPLACNHERRGQPSNRHPSWSKALRWWRLASRANRGRSEPHGASHAAGGRQAHAHQNLRHPTKRSTYHGCFCGTCVWLCARDCWPGAGTAVAL